MLTGYLSEQTTLGVELEMFHILFMFGAARVEKAETDIETWNGVG